MADKRNDRIVFEIEGEGPVEFFILEETRIAGTSYLLVTDSEDEDGEAWILKDTSADGDEEAVYEMVEDENELDALGKVFAQMLEDIDLQ